MVKNEHTNHFPKGKNNSDCLLNSQKTTWVGAVNGPNGKWVIIGATVISLGILIIIDRKVGKGSTITADIFRGAFHIEIKAA